MQVAMLILALYGSPQHADWRVVATTVVPAAHCDAERAKFDQPGSSYRIVCDNEQRSVHGDNNQIATKP